MIIFEFDTEIGKKHKKALLTIDDRATDFYHTCKVTNPSSR